MDIRFGNEHFGLKKYECGVYKIVFNEQWFYIGSSVDLRRRLSNWKYKIIGGEISNRSVRYILPSVILVRFEILELVSDKKLLRAAETAHIQAAFNDSYSLNLVPDAVTHKGRKLPLGITRKEKRKKALPTPKKKVAQFDLYGNLIKVYESIGDAARATGEKPDFIRKVFNGRQINPRRYIFKGVAADGSFIEPKYSTKISEETVRFIIENYKTLGNAKLRRMFGLAESYVRKIALGQSKGHMAQELSRKPFGQVQKPKRVYKIDFDGNIVCTHNSIGEAARSIGAKTSTVQRALSPSKEYYSVKGYRFRYAD